MNYEIDRIANAVRDASHRAMVWGLRSIAGVEGRATV